MLSRPHTKKPLYIGTVDLSASEKATMHAVRNLINAHKRNFMIHYETAATGRFTLLNTCDV